MESTEAASDYRPISRLAVAALAAGVASLVVFIGPAMTMIVPLAALATALAALAHLRRVQILAGKRLVLVGLALALASLVGGPAFWLASEWQLRRTAATVAESWIHSVQEGDLRRAHQLTLAGHQRFPEMVRLTESYAKFPEAREALAEFSADEAVATIREHDGPWRLAAVEKRSASRNEQWFGLRYESRPEDQPAGDPAAIRISVRRLTDPKGEYTWHIGGFGLETAEE